jgi:hypothetical protein
MLNKGLVMTMDIKDKKIQGFNKIQAKRKLKLKRQIIRIKIKLLIVSIITNNKIEKILLLKSKKL